MTDSAQDTPAPAIGQEVFGPGKQFFDNVVHDNLLESLLELTAAVWTCQDRIMILENVLSDLVGDNRNVAELVEAYQPSAQQEAARAAARAELVQSVFRSFSRRPVPGVSPAQNGVDS